MSRDSAEFGLTIIVGPMFSGKTTELLRMLTRYRMAGYSTILVKPSIDRRYSDREVVSHDGLKMEALVIEPNFNGLLSVAEELKSADVIGIDELQFFEYNSKIVDFLLRISLEKRIFAAALNLDFRGEPWEIVKELLPRADEIISLQAVCTYIDPRTGKRCGSPATRTQRLIDGKAAPRDAPRILIGGRESYEPRCRRHHEVL
ncbi:MAG: thymidine kinase [Fervidicoccaceae archaeon]